RRPDGPGAVDCGYARHCGHGLRAKAYCARGTAQRRRLSILPLGHVGLGLRAGAISLGPLWLGNGVPAFAAAVYTRYKRVETKEHHWYDVAASAGFAFGFSKIFTTRYHPPGLI